MASLSTTSYAILGLLALRPWSAYELTEYMKTSAVGTLWPRARSSLYEEPKKLVAHGLATVRQEKHRGPRRSVYEITPVGRASLRSWLREPSAPPRVESEPMLKLALADQAGKPELLARIREIRQVTSTAFQAAGIDAVLARDLSFPERAHVSAMVFRLGLEVGRAIRRWSDWAEAEAAGWPDDLSLGDEERARFAEMYTREWVDRFMAGEETDRR